VSADIIPFPTVDRIEDRCELCGTPECFLFSYRFLEADGSERDYMICEVCRDESVCTDPSCPTCRKAARRTRP
jgi:hypothetical protein